MKRLLLVFLFLSGLLRGYSQGSPGYTDPADQQAASFFAEARQASRGQTIWSKDLYGPILFVDEETRTTWANEPDSAGILHPDGEIYKGKLPDDVMIANTAIVWQGKRWSVILWPLPKDRDGRVSLLLHECFHRIQAQLGLPERGPTVSHLSSMDGRIYYLLELQALKSALAKPVSERNKDLENALLFREKRHILFPETFEKERILEMSEGLAEYTGVILGRQPDSIRGHLYQQIDSAAERKSLLRSSAYITGPVYGYLLFQAFPRWTSSADSNSSFPALLTRYYHLSPAVKYTEAALNNAITSYNGMTIIRSEQQKERERQRLVARYTDIYTRQPVLTIQLINMNISFNPNNLFDMGQYGTIFPNAQVKDKWGQLEVTSGGVLMKDWKIVHIPVTSPSLLSGTEITGQGWKLTLNKGWTIRKLDELHYELKEGE